MSSNYSANQYDGAFRSQRLQNWCEARQFKKRSTAHWGHTTIIADDRGHLLPGVKKGSARPDFKGTWDLPARIPAHHTNPTSRSAEGLNRLKSWGIDPQHTGKSQPHRGSSSTDRLQDVGKQADAELQQDSVASVREVRPASQNLPITGYERTASPKQDLQAAVDRSIGQLTEEKQVFQAAGNSMPLSHCSAATEKPALRPAAREGTNSRPDTGKGRPSSSVTKKEASQGAPSSSKNDTCRHTM